MKKAFYISIIIGIVISLTIQLNVHAENQGNRQKEILEEMLIDRLKKMSEELINEKLNEVFDDEFVSLQIIMNDLIRSIRRFKGNKRSEKMILDMFILLLTVERMNEIDIEYAWSILFPTLTDEVKIKDLLEDDTELKPLRSRLQNIFYRLDPIFINSDEYKSNVAAFYALKPWVILCLDDNRYMNPNNQTKCSEGGMTSDLRKKILAYTTSFDALTIKDYNPKRILVDNKLDERSSAKNELDRLINGILIDASFIELVSFLSLRKDPLISFLSEEIMTKEMHIELADMFLMWSVSRKQIEKTLNTFWGIEFDRESQSIRDLLFMEFDIDISFQYITKIKNHYPSYNFLVSSVVYIKENRPFTELCKMFKKNCSKNLSLFFTLLEDLTLYTDFWKIKRKSKNESSIDLISKNFDSTTFTYNEFDTILKSLIYRSKYLYLSIGGTVGKQVKIDYTSEDTLECVAKNKYEEEEKCDDILNYYHADIGGKFFFNDGIKWSRFANIYVGLPLFLEERSQGSGYGLGIQESVIIGFDYGVRYRKLIDLKFTIHNLRARTHLKNNSLLFGLGVSVPLSDYLELLGAY